jgi:hypothetical protein
MRMDEVGGIVAKRRGHAAHGVQQMYWRQRVVQRIDANGPGAKPLHLLKEGAAAAGNEGGVDAIAQASVEVAHMGLRPTDLTLRNDKGDARPPDTVLLHGLRVGICANLSCCWTCGLY